ncbi:MAG: hypothetical protein HKN76_10870, partial [Saprospiraceae bacterium]|nr:hypothetical protein [Saprospiraceae bacterium]
ASELDADLLNLPPDPPANTVSNHHIYYIKLKNKYQRDLLMKTLQSDGIHSVFHYIPLHLSAMGKSIATFSHDDIHTTIESERLLRLPLFDSLTIKEVRYICARINQIVTGFMKQDPEIITQPSSNEFPAGLSALPNSTS